MKKHLFAMTVIIVSPIPFLLRGIGIDFVCLDITTLTILGIVVAYGCLEIPKSRRINSSDMNNLWLFQCFFLILFILAAWTIIYSYNAFLRESRIICTLRFFWFFLSGIVIGISCSVLRSHRKKITLITMLFFLICTLGVLFFDHYYFWAWFSNNLLGTNIGVYKLDKGIILPQFSDWITGWNVGGARVNSCLLSL